jgi:DNA-binding MarR family transcriptional regulator
MIALDSAALGRILDRLEVSRWARRHPHPGDRRARSLVITEEARALLPFMWSIVAESQRAALRGFSTEETQFLMSALERVLANLRLCAGVVE